jgi:hypothetical protein
MMAVVVRTHGGVGNQLFQLFHGRLLAETRGEQMFEEHDTRYYHGFERSAALPSAPSPPRPWMRALSRLRLPKLLTRAKLRCDQFRVASTTFTDGYFQRPQDYARFSDAMIARQLIRLRDELNVPATPSKDVGVHLRLGDFFTSEQAVGEHLDARLAQIETGAQIVTNDEARLAAPSVAALLAAKDATIVPTGNMTPEQVLCTLASFRSVDGNDSTLLFWASALSGMECTFQSPTLSALQARFRTAMRAAGDTP